MKKWFQKIMVGRYGVDHLSLALLLVFCIMSLILSFFTKSLLRFIPYVLIILCYFRIFSKNYTKRYNENRVFLNIFGPYFDKISLFFKHLKQSKNYKFIKCPHCKQRLRIPRKKGKIEITCAKCHHNFDGRS